MREGMVAVLLVVSALLMLLSGVGLVRMPDLFLRMQTTSKAATLGICGLLAAAALALWDIHVTVRALLSITFIFAIVPLATQLIAHAAFRAGLPLWERTVQNDLGERRPGGREEPQVGPTSGGQPSPPEGGGGPPSRQA